MKKVDHRVIHGDAGTNRAPEYTAWKNMRARCTNKRDPAYPEYGGRGIHVCKRWLTSYKNFLTDMGRRPSPTHSLERLKNHLGYHPGNCVWATATAQQLNRSGNVRYKLGNVSGTIGEWAKMCAMNKDTLLSRLRLGWSFAKAVSTPVRKLQK